MQFFRTPLGGWLFQVRFAGIIHDGWDPWDPDNSFERFREFVQPRILMGQSPRVLSLEGRCLSEKLRVGARPQLGDAWWMSRLFTLRGPKPRPQIHAPEELSL